MTETERSTDRIVDVLVQVGLILAAVAGAVLVAYGLNLFGPPGPPVATIEVESRPDVATAAAGDVVAYTVVISNLARERTVEILSISDTLLGDLSDAFPSDLEAGASAQETFMRAVRLADPDPLRNTVTVAVRARGNVIEAASTAAVDVLKPAVSVEAALTPQAAAPGEEVVYSVSVSNVGEVVLEPITVTDSIEGDLSSSFSERMAPGASQGQAFGWEVPPDATGSLTRTVTVYAGTTGRVVSAAAAVALDLTKPAVRIEAAVSPAAAEPGDTVTYTVSVTNAGRVALDVVTVTDSLEGDLSPSFPSALTVGASQQRAFAWAVDPDDSLPITRTVTVRAEGTGQVVSDTAAVVLDRPRPVLRVEPSVAPTTTVRGGGATYTLTVVNAGQVDVGAIEVRDLLLGDVSQAFPRTLPAGTSHSQTYTWSSEPDASGPLIRSVIVSGEGAGQVVSDTATAALNLAGVAISTSSPERIQAGERISATVTITNTSSPGAPDLVLETVVNSGRELSVPDACRVLAAGEACSFGYEIVAPPGEDALTTGVEARYRPRGGTRVVTASAGHTLAVASPWQQGAGTPAGAEVRALAVCAADADVLYAGFGSRGEGVYRSTDGGRSWVATALAGEDTEVFGLAVDPDDCDTVYAAAWRGGVRRSTDGGRTWAASPAGLEGAFVYSVVVDPADGDVLYAGTAERGVYRSDDAGASWRNWGLDALTVPHLTVASDGRVVVAATWGDGVHRRERSGVGWADWLAVSGGIAREHRDVYAVVVDPADAATVFAATASGGVYRTVDGGGTWEQVLSSPATAYAVAVAPGRSVVYAGTGEGVYVSDAAGESGSWESVDVGTDGLAVRSLALGSDGTVHLGTTDGPWRRLP
jgi:uncharacterized repeat protein (TIGR01451 family)